MELKKYFDETSRIENELSQTRKQYERLIDTYHEVRKLCTHDIVFKYLDNRPRMATIDGNYFCPACNLVIQYAEKRQIETSKYKNARVIPLLNLSLSDGKDLHNAIRQEVYENLDLYYDKEVSVEELSSKMEGVLASHHHDYINPSKVLKKIK